MRTKIRLLAGVAALVLVSSVHTLAFVRERNFEEGYWGNLNSLEPYGACAGTIRASGSWFCSGGWTNDGRFWYVSCDDQGCEAGVRCEQGGPEFQCFGEHHSTADENGIFGHDNGSSIPTGGNHNCNWGS